MNTYIFVAGSTFSAAALENIVAKSVLSILQFAVFIIRPVTVGRINSGRSFF
jgi:hypothetical protein